MRKGTVAALALAILVCVVWPVGAAVADDVALTVSVVNESDEPVGGATVEASWDGGETTATTASNGRVFIDVPEGEDVELDIDDDRYVRNQPLLVEDADEREVELSVVSRGSATVTVLDTDEDPISEATVRLRKDGTTITSGETDADGVYRSEDVEQGQYNVSAVKPGYFRETFDLSVGAETEAETTLESGRVTLDVDVVDDYFEEPQTLRDGRIQIEDREDEDVFDADISASDGSASLNVPVNTRYRITAIRDGYDGTPRAINVAEQQRTVTVTAQRVHELVATASNRRVIVGETTRIEVVNAYGDPVPEATIRIDGEEVGETDDRGEIAVEIDSVSEKEVVASDDRVESDPITITGVDPDADDESAPEPQPEPEPEDQSGFGIAVGVVAVLAAFAVGVLRNQ